MAEAEYETLVRQQLTELGYDANAIPDEVCVSARYHFPPCRLTYHRSSFAQVLREFLADFEEKMELGDGGEPSSNDAAQLSYPTALNSAEARSFAPPKDKKTVPAGSSSGAHRKAAPGAAKPASKAAPPRASKGAPPSSRPPPSLPPATASLLTEMPPANPSADQYDAAMDIGDVADDDDGDAPVVPRFTPAQWDSLQPAVSTPRKASSRPQSARVAGSPRGLGSSSALGPHSARAPIDMRPPLGSSSGVIHSRSMIATPKRAKCDPVSLHAKRQAQWRTNSYLSLTTKRTGPPIDMSPAPRTVQMAKRSVNNYVVPTAKRRDDLVWQTRQRLRQADVDAGGVSARTPSKRLVPNAFVPATEKRRDDLRWAVRTEMAWVR